MLQTLYKLALAWPLVIRRSLSHWKLLSSVVIGVLLASVIMAGTVIYFDALRELALDNSLAKLTTNETDILIKTDRGPTSEEEYNKVSKLVLRQVDTRIPWLLTDRTRGGKTATFYLTVPGNEALAGEDEARSYFAFLPRLLDHVTLIDGRLPLEQALSAPGEILELEAMVPVEAAELFDLSVGSRLSAVPYWSDVMPYASVVISGIFETPEPDIEFWYLDDETFKSSTRGGFRTVPFYISETTFMEVLGGSFRDLDSTYGWLLSVDPTRLNARNASLTKRHLDTMERRLSSDLFSYRQITGLERSLAEYDRRLFFSKAPMFIILILIAVVILYYVVTISSLLVEQQRAEISLLRSRGATSAQVLAVFVLEGATISLLAVVIAPIVAAFVISMLGYTSAFSDLSGSGRLAVSISGGAYMMSGLGGILSFLALMIPAVQASRIEVAKHRQQAARPSSQPFFQRYYLDLMLLVVTVFLFRQLSEQGSVVAVGLFGEVAISQVLLAVPALMLIAFGMVLLRLFPLFMRYVSGDSPFILDLIVAGSLLIVAPALAISGTFGDDGFVWVAQVALIVALGGVYLATGRTTNLGLRIGGLALQAGLVVSTLYLAGSGICVAGACWSPQLVGADLPIRDVFGPLLIAIVPAGVAFMFFKAYAQRAPVGFSMGMWQMARNPTHYARLSLLLVLMSGLGVFAATFGGTLQRNFKERAFYSTGADIRLEGVMVGNRGSTMPFVESYEQIDGVSKASPVFRGYGVDLSRLLGEDYRMFATDGEAFSDVAWFRDDFSDEPLDGLLKSLAMDSLPEGLELPMDVLGIGVTVRADRPHPSVAVTVRIRDTNDRYMTYFLGNLTSGGWLSLETGLERVSRFGRRARLQPVYPVTFVSLSFHETDGRNDLRAGSVLIDEIRVRTRGNGVQVIESFDDVSKWNVLRGAPESVSDVFRRSDVAVEGRTGSAQFIWTRGSPLTSRGIFNGPPLSPLPVLASRSFLKEIGHDLGDEFPVSVAGHRMPIRLVAAIDYFPTLDTLNEKFLISNLTALSRYANLETMSSELRPIEVWLSTDTVDAERSSLVENLSLNGPFPVRVVHDRLDSLAKSQVDPLVDAGWNALLFIAFSAVLILSGIGFLVHTYVSFRTREVQFALMRTIGFSMRQIITLVWLEQALVIAAGLALGTWMGGRVGQIMMPFLSHDDRGSEVLPPFVIQVNWGTLAITYGAMALVFALITVGVILFIQRISLQRILRLGEM